MASATLRRIGSLVPSSNTVQEIEFRRALPDWISLHTTRLTLTQIDADSTKQIVAELESESRKLADADVDVIVLATTAPSSRMGAGYDRELIRRIEGASGKPAITAATASVEALQALGAKRIVLGAPWSEAVNASTAAFLEASGVTVLAQQALGIVRNLDVGRLDHASAYEMGRRVDRPDAVVMLACGNWRTFGSIERLERDLGKPVLSTNLVSLWAALRIIGAAPIAGYGTLLREHLPGGAARQTAAE